MRILWKAVSTLVESSAEVSMKLRLFFSANAFASSVGTARRWRRSDLFPTLKETSQILLINDSWLIKRHLLLCYNFFSFTDFAIIIVFFVRNQANFNESRQPCKTPCVTQVCTGRYWSLQYTHNLHIITQPKAWKSKHCLIQCRMCLWNTNNWNCWHANWNGDQIAKSG